LNGIGPKDIDSTPVFPRYYSPGLPGFDHGVGHPLLLLYDAKAPNYKNGKKFNGLGHYPSNTALSSS
jgi:hypothetical protein